MQRLTHLRCEIKILHNITICLETENLIYINRQQVFSKIESLHLLDFFVMLPNTNPIDNWFSQGAAKKTINAIITKNVNSANSIIFSVDYLTKLS